MNKCALNGRLMRALSLIMCVGIVFISCASTKPGSKPGTRIESYAAEQIIENSRMLGNRLEIKERNADRVNGLLRIQIRAENITRKGYEFEFKYRWLDNNGMVVGTPSSVWRPIFVNPKDIAHIQGLAPNENVVDFVFDIRFSSKR